MEHGGGESVQGHAIRDVQQQPKHEGHDHTHSQRSPQNSHHENRQIHHTKEEFSKEALAASLVRGSMLAAIKTAPGTNHHGVVDVVDKSGRGDKRRGRGLTRVWPAIPAGPSPPLGMILTFVCFFYICLICFVFAVIVICFVFAWRQAWDEKEGSACWIYLELAVIVICFVFA